MEAKSSIVKRKNTKKANKLSTDNSLKNDQWVPEAKSSLLVAKPAWIRCTYYGVLVFALFSLFLAIYLFFSLGETDSGTAFGSFLVGLLGGGINVVPKVNGTRQFENDSIWVLDKRYDLTLREFIEKYDGKRPVVITDALTGWKANNWSKDFFVKNYGDQNVVMKAVHGKLRQAESLALPLKLFGQHSAKGSPTTWTYLQDELFIQLHPELKEHLRQPIYLREDFFQLFPADLRPWNAMLLWGTPYSRSYLHIDPYNWTGTNAVFSGAKLWKLYPPGQDQYLYVRSNVKSGFPLNCFKYNSPIDAFDPDFKKYPLFKKAKAISFAQKPGELLIIPPGWFHQAFNEIETIAVSSQTMNSQNYHIILEEIIKAGNINKDELPKDFSTLSPVNQVKAVVKSLPPFIVKRGKEVTTDILKQMGYPTN